MMSLGDRMKDYEKVWANKLPRRLPVMARLDGISFSKLTKNMTKPHDDLFHRAMVDAATAVVKKSAGSVLAYTQSDEITILLRNNQTFGTEPFLGNKVQKLVSHLAGYATAAFCASSGQSASFDCRAWVNPEAEIVNQFLWRQKDAFKNCVSSVAIHKLREKYGRKTVDEMLHGKTTDERQEIIFKETGLNMNDYPAKYRRGSCIVNESYLHKEVIEDLVCTRKRWVEDTDIPLFSQDPGYIMDRYCEGVEE